MTNQQSNHPASRLDRFKSAQDSPHSGFAAALDEIESGAKTSHWIWYIFPQLSGLGSSRTSQSFAIDDEDEAAAFLRDPLLRQRLLTITAAVAKQLARPGTSLTALMGSDTDARKLVSSLTLFGPVARTLHASEGLDAGEAIAAAADEVLAVAASQGYPRCAHTLRRLAAGG